MEPTFREYIDKLRLTADIVEVIGQHVALKRAGTNFKGLCPFHQEKTPSFVVSPDRQTFHCFGCGVGGDVIHFVQRAENLEWIEALEALARRFGMEAPPRQGRQQDDEQNKRRDSLFALNRMAADFYAELLGHPSQGGAARAYLERRGIPGGAIGRFGLGVAPEGWDNLLRAAKLRGYSENLLTAAGLAIRNEERGSCYDRFRGRVMFPIGDGTGRIIAFGGRLFDRDEGAEAGAKYINSPETPLFKKSQTLYALHLARDAMKAKGRAIVLEGYTDVISLHMHGFDNAVATLGTALTESHAKLLRRFAKEVILLYDDDEAGRNAMQRGVEILAAHEIAVYCVSLGEGEDPDSFLRTRGTEAMAQRLEQARPFFEHFLGMARKRFDFNKTEDRSAAVDWLAPIVRSIKNSGEADGCISLIADALHVVPAALRQKLRPELAGKRIRSTGDRDSFGDLLRERIHAWEAWALRILIEYPQVAADHSSFDPEWFEDPRIRIWIERASNLTPDERADVWGTLLATARNDEEAGILREIALIDRPVTPTMFAELAGRLKSRWQLKKAREEKIKLVDAPPAPSGEKTTDVLQRLHTERIETTRSIPPTPISL